MLPSTTYQDKITDELVAQLARDVAADLIPPEKLIEAYALTQQEFDRIARTDKFQVYLQNARLGWNALENIEDRVRKRAAAVLETSLLHYHKLIRDPKEPLSSKVQAGELLRKICSIGNNTKVEGGGGEKFTLVINIGKTAKTIDGEVINTIDYSKSENEA